MFPVAVGSEHQRLTLTPDVAVGGVPQFLVAELQLDGLTASARVAHNYATGFADLAEFFDLLERDWRGWQGVRNWESLEGDLRIDASHEFGHVRLRIHLRRGRLDWGNDGWTATGDVTIEAGEQLSQVARDIRTLATLR